MVFDFIWLTPNRLSGLFSIGNQFPRIRQFPRNPGSSKINFLKSHRCARSQGSSDISFLEVKERVYVGSFLEDINCNSFSESYTKTCASYTSAR